MVVSVVGDSLQHCYKNSAPTKRVDLIKSQSSSKQLTKLLFLLYMLVTLGVCCVLVADSKRFGMRLRKVLVAFNNY